MLSFLSIASFIYWIYISTVAAKRVAFIARHMELSELQRDRSEAKRSIARFTSNFIKIDGVFVLRMVTAHASALFCTELVQALWNQYLKPEPESQIQKLTQCWKQIGVLNSIEEIDDMNADSILEECDESPHMNTAKFPLLNSIKVEWFVFITELQYRYIGDPTFKISSSNSCTQFMIFLLLKFSLEGSLQFAFVLIFRKSIISCSCWWVRF